uniref:Uncharacterized protein n=1 Tax=Kryptolebias marmoratus TaxID=37003 RepID=A0A3Q2ZLN0_KRYMA
FVTYALLIMGFGFLFKTERALITNRFEGFTETCLVFFRNQCKMCDSEYKSCSLNQGCLFVCFLFS